MKVNDILLDKYVILKIVSGDGSNRRGMSNLYKAQDKDLGMYWAIKEIIKSPDGKVTLQQSALIKEAQILRKLQHPSIPRIVSIEHLPDRILIVMDWVDGRSVGEWVRASGPMTGPRVVSIMQQVCQVLSYLHNRPTPIFYRDMKPENIMYDLNTKRVMLLDFGISVELGQDLTITDRVGTQGYVDPYSLALTKKEREKGMKERTFDLRSDIYSLGWTMFHMITGISPVYYQKTKKSKGEEITRDVREYVKDISPALADIVIKATEPLPKDRYQSVEELLIDLNDIEKIDTGYFKKTQKQTTRRINTVLGLGIVGFLLSVGSLAPYLSYESSLKNQYETLVVQATKSGSFSDYLKVIDYKPSEITPYFGALDAIKADGAFSKEEEDSFLDLLNSNLPSLEKDSRYPELAFEVGRLYWLYGTEDNSQEVASRWFKDAGTYNNLAPVFASIGSFPTDVVKASNEGTDSGMYKKQWETLASVEGQSELVELQVARSQLSLLSSYPYRLQSDGVSTDSITQTLESIEKLIESTKDSDGRVGTLSKELTPLLEEAKKVVKEVFNA